MHKEIVDYIGSLNQERSDYFSQSVLEIGSRDTSFRWGTPRQLFTGHNRYVGVDRAAGNNVDIVSLGHEFRFEENFKAILCFEVFEHDPFWRQTIENAIRHTQDDSIFCWSCASLAREVHGLSDSPVENYYENRTIDDIESQILESVRKFGKYVFESFSTTRRDGQDIIGYVIIKKREDQGEISHTSNH